jgi:zinc D-Ala-D-Ala carboxypeptidase
LSASAPIHEDYLARVHGLLAELGLNAALERCRTLPLCVEATELVVAERSPDGRTHLLTPAAAAAWQHMRAAAAADAVEITIVSAFRSLERQAQIIRGKLAAGLPLDAIFRASAPPGYSEHHTGRAIDINTPGARPLEVEFENTGAFAWLTLNAASHGFSLSYPRDNAFGFIYEPWHWCFRADR